MAREVKWYTAWLRKGLGVRGDLHVFRGEAPSQILLLIKERVDENLATSFRTLFFLLEFKNQHKRVRGFTLLVGVLFFYGNVRDHCCR